MAALAAVPDDSLLTPEYIAYTNAPVLLTQFGSLFAVASVVVLARCYVRAVMIKSFGKDDWLMVLAYGFSAATFGTYVEQTNVGLGRHMAVILTDQKAYKELLRLRQVASILASFGVALVKISIAYFLLRLMVHRAYVWFLHGLNIFITLFTFACVGTLVSLILHIYNYDQLSLPSHPESLYVSSRGLREYFNDRIVLIEVLNQIWQCIPVEATWDLKLRPPPYGNGTAKCFSPDTFTSIGLMNTVITIVTDFMVALLPVPLIWQLQLNLHSKISLIFVLSLGIFAAIAAIVKAEIQSTVFQDPDPFIHDRFTLWRFIELDVGIIAASLPALKPLFNWFLGAARNLTTRTPRATAAPDSMGHHKHSVRFNKAIVLDEYNDRANTVRISSRPSNGCFWSVGPGKDSDESILPLNNVEENPNGIIVTRDVHVV